MFAPVVHERLGRLYEARGDASEAAEHYRAFADARGTLRPVEPDGTRSLKISSHAGEEVGRLARGYHRVTEPSWALDGERVVYATVRAEGESYQSFLETVR